MQASARFGEGMLAMATANFNSARICFEDALDLWDRSAAPFETAQARMGLAQSLLALGRVQEAEQQAQTALKVFTHLRAMPVVAFAEYLLQQIEAATQVQGKSATTPGPDLTSREIEVLNLIASGKSNQEIAGDLGLSIRTVERHISNIYTKIGATGPTARATATAFAHKHGPFLVRLA
jgi:DNA-binding NarL/FixJ family response regulator